MAREKASFLIQSYLQDLSIQQLQALHNVHERKDWPELVSTCQTLINFMRNDVFQLPEIDPNLAINKSRLTGQVNGIIILKQLFEHATAELNRRMKETK